MDAIDDGEPDRHPYVVSTSCKHAKRFSVLLRDFTFKRDIELLIFVANPSESHQNIQYVIDYFRCSCPLQFSGFQSLYDDSETKISFTSFTLFSTHKNK